MMVFLCSLLISQIGWSAPELGAFSYPELLLAEQGLSVQDVIQNQDKFKTNKIHIEWMMHAHAVIPDMNPDTETQLIKIHTAMLYLKDRINSEYLNGGMDKAVFSSRSATLMQWFQRTHQTMLSAKEYTTLFGILGEDGFSENIPTGNKLGFPIQNPKTTAEMIEKKIDAQKIAEIARFYQDHAREFRDIKEIYETGDVPGVEKEQIKTDMQQIEKDLDAAYRDYCRRILTAQEFRMIFNDNSGK
ncbi:MAG: hypothetical protein ABIK15_19020 [Pseudomonadota bacterium]